MVRPLTALTSSKVPFLWSPEAESTLGELKIRFSIAPILVMPKSEEQFILEVEASDIGAVLSQRTSDGKVYPCAYFSCCLFTAERDYAVGDWELLALKLALEEWRHLLEGTTVPFIVWTDHRNLEYLRTAKRLNPRQARWSLQFSHFNFTLSYRPGSRNVKPEALSRLYTSSLDSEVSDTIPPPRTMFAATRLEIVAKVERALLGKVISPNTRANRGPARGLRVLEWAHSSSPAGRPGVRRTLALLNRQFWWSSFCRDVEEFVTACPVCAQAKGNSQCAQGLLQPLLVPHCPWSHIAIDFVTGLPESQGHTVILTTVDRFSTSHTLIAEDICCLNSLYIS